MTGSVPSTRTHESLGDRVRLFREAWTSLDPESPVGRLCRGSLAASAAEDPELAAEVAALQQADGEGTPSTVTSRPAWGSTGTLTMSESHGDQIRLFACGTFVILNGDSVRMDPQDLIDVGRHFVDLGKAYLSAIAAETPEADGE